MTKKQQKPSSKDYEKIIQIQEGIIKAKEQENIQSWNTWIDTWDKKDLYEYWYNRLWYQNRELERQVENLSKEYYEVVRAYNALHHMGKFAEELGIDIKRHSDELPENKYKDYDFNIENKVLESGKVKTTFKATKRKKDKCIYKPSKKKKEKSND